MSQSRGAQMSLQNWREKEKSGIKDKRAEKNAPDDCSHYFIELLKSQPLNAPCGAL